MKKHWKILLGTSATVVTLLIGTGIWYVFIAGAPQLDPPAISEPGTGMTFQYFL
jgi:uncharacterized membrane protein